MSSYNIGSIIHCIYHKCLQFSFSVEALLHGQVLFGLVGVTLDGGFGTLNNVCTAHYYNPSFLVVVVFELGFFKMVVANMITLVEMMWCV